MISAAVNVKDGTGLLATENARDITRIVRAERYRLGMVLAAAVLASVLLSLFLSRTIVQPLQHLTRAAVRVRLGRAREELGRASRRDRVCQSVEIPVVAVSLY